LVVRSLEVFALRTTFDTIYCCSTGKYPVESVTMQQLIINNVETDETHKESLDRFASDNTLHRSRDATTTAITLAARQVADISKSKAILAFTQSGGTVLRVSKVRPNVPIIAACYSWETARQLALAWGVYPIVLERSTGDFALADEIEKALKVVCARGFANADTDLVTVTAGLPFGISGTTNVLRVASAKGPDYWFDSNNTGMKKFVSVKPPI
jgi:pyruvate kinase